MKAENMSLGEEFLIVGFSDFFQHQIPLFVTFLLIYMIILVGNLLIMATVYCNPLLQTPMYFFLTNLSFIDISYTSVIFPHMLVNFFMEGTQVSLTVCLLQMYCFLFMMATEVVLLAVMAFDRYVAICNPLRYMAIMNKNVCLWLATGSWVNGLVEPLAHIVLLSKLSFCESHTINHFFCDTITMMKLSCSSIRTIEILNYILCTIVTGMAFVLIIMSYSNIIRSILKIKSTEGRQKAISTCTSHIMVVILFYVSLCSTYMRPTSTASIEDNKLLSLSYIAVTPLFNPIIYSLKNTDFKKAFLHAMIRRPNE